MADSGTVDASLLLTLENAAALDLLWHNRRSWFITPIVRSEIVREPARSELAEAILAGTLAIAEPDDEEEMRLFANWSSFLGPGEAEAIAVAVARGWVVALEDRHAQRRLTAEHGRESWVNCASLLLEAVNEGRLSLSAADAIFLRLDSYRGYEKRGIRSVRDLPGFGREGRVRRA